MKKHNLFIASVAVIVAMAVGSAGAAPIRGGGHHVQRPIVTHTHGVSRHGGHHAVHHNPTPVVPVVVSHHHHHHHDARAGNIIIATAILLSALI